MVSRAGWEGHAGTLVFSTKDSGLLDKGKPCGSRGWHPESSIALAGLLRFAQESSRRAHLGDVWPSMSEVQECLETQTSLLAQELSANDLGKNGIIQGKCAWWEEGKLQRRTSSPLCFSVLCVPCR